MKLAPSILTADLSRIGQQIREAEEAGVDSIHLDVMDGHFVPNLTIGPLVVAAVRSCTSLPLDVHLMIENPERYVASFAEAGATSMTVHREVCPHLQRQITAIKELGCRACVALNPATPLVMIEDVLNDVDGVLIMTVNPGFGGQGFIPHSLDKIQRARLLLDDVDRPVELQVDGGVNASNIKAVADAGATNAVVGSAVYAPHRSVTSSVQLLRDALS